MSNTTNPAQPAEGGQPHTATDAFPVPQRMTPADFEKMQAEADKRWANRPRPVPQQPSHPDLKFEEPRVCRLPNGGVSDNARAQLERNRLRREAEAQAKAQQTQHEQEQHELREL